MNLVKYIPFYRRWRTKQHQGYWRDRKINWQDHYTSTWDIPRRHLLVQILKTFHWLSLIEVGVGGGANLVAIAKAIGRGVQLGGIDINPDAIAHTRTLFAGHGIFSVCKADDIMMSDKSTDVVLSDMIYIYVNGKDIDRHMKEAARIGRNHVVFHEFYTQSWWERLKLKATSGYTAHDWKKVLERNDFYDIIIYKIPEEMCGGDTQKKFSHIIKAKVPQR